VIFRQAHQAVRLLLRKAPAPVVTARPAVVIDLQSSLPDTVFLVPVLWKC